MSQALLATYTPSCIFFVFIICLKSNLRHIYFIIFIFNLNILIELVLKILKK